MLYILSKDSLHLQLHGHQVQEKNENGGSPSGQDGKRWQEVKVLGGHTHTDQDG